MKTLLFVLLAATAAAAEPLSLTLWPEGAPGKVLPHSPATEAFIKKHQSKNTVTDIAEPTISVYRPEKPNGTSVIVAPGGGFVFLSSVHEGTQVCEWLNTLGVTAILLNYRTPTRDEPAPHEKPVQDAQQALKIVRAHAAEWNLNPKRVGLLGFSAGGNLLGHLACDRDLSNYPASHDRDAGLPRPDFGIMIYGGGFLDPKDPTKLNPTFTVPADAAPMFIACAHDDGQNPIASTLLYLEYKKQNIPAELHLFTKGGHGFGMRKAGHPINEWPARCAEWMDSMGWLPTVEKLNSAIDHGQTRLNEIKKLVATATRCVSDMPILEKKLLQTKVQLLAAQAANDKNRALAAEDTIKAIQGVLNEYLAPLPFNLEEIANEAEVLTQQIATFESELEQLLTPSASSSIKPVLK